MARHASAYAEPIPILTVADVRAVEADWIRRAPLMERAGAAACEAACRSIGQPCAAIAVLCGPGNNGGDGLVAARRLREAGHEVEVLLGADVARLPPEAAAALAAWRAADGGISDTLPSAGRFALAIDALFGIGLTRPIGGVYAEWIDWLNRCDCPVLSLDVPSGLDADRGGLTGPAVRATHTLTFIALKPGLLTLDGPDHCGRISIDDLGIAPVPAPATTVTPALFAERLVARARNSHKGMTGDAAVIGGASGMIGAALLAARAAVHLGAGRVFAGLLADDAPRVDPVCPELMPRAPAEAIAAADAIAIGPGLGRDTAARRLVEVALARDAPLVLDADALNLVAAHPVLARALARRTAATLLTPHPAEAARLLAVTTETVQRDRVQAALELAKRLCAHVALKGCGTLLAAPDGRWWINTSGNPGMATAGMGDVLTGIALALLAQGWDARSALLAAVHLHGAAADRLVERGEGPVGLTAGEVIAPARALLNEWIGS